MSHYFENDESLKNDSNSFFKIINNVKAIFETTSGVFSKKKVDAGTEVLLEYLPNLENIKTCIDCGSGYGVISVFLKKFYPSIKITGVDINKRALALARKNASLNNLKIDFLESDFFSKVDKKFDLIISNPPIIIGKEKLFLFYKDGKDYLTDNGICLFVVAKDKGANSSIEYLKTIYKDVSVLKKKKGYFIIMSKN